MGTSNVGRLVFFAGLGCFTAGLLMTIRRVPSGVSLSATSGFSADDMECDVWCDCWIAASKAVLIATLVAWLLEGWASRSDIWDVDQTLCLLSSPAASGWSDSSLAVWGGV